MACELNMEAIRRWQTASMNCLKKSHRACDEESSPEGDAIALEAAIVQDRTWLAQMRWAVEFRQRQDDSAIQRGIGLLALQGVLIALLSEQLRADELLMVRVFQASSLALFSLGIVFALFIVLARRTRSFNDTFYRSEWDKWIASGEPIARLEGTFAGEMLGSYEMIPSVLEQMSENVIRRNNAQRWSVIFTGMAIVLLVICELVRLF